MKTIKSIFKWLAIITLVGMLCSVADGIIFILAAIFIYHVFIKGKSSKETLKGGLNWAGERVDRMKE